MNRIVDLPWLEIAVLLCLIGAICISRMRQPLQASHWGLAFTGSVFVCTLLAGISSYLHEFADVTRWSVQPTLFGEKFFALDELSAPLAPMVALLHFLTALATARTKMRRFSLSWSLTAEAIRLATVGCRTPWMLIVCLCLNAVPPYFELVNRGKPTRVYVLYMSLFIVLLVLGWTFVDPTDCHSAQSILATIAIMAAVMLRSGVFPLHSWVLDWFEHASFGNALLYVTPLIGVFAAVRLVLPIAPDWVLRGIGNVSLASAVYCAGMATVQRDMRRFFAFVFLSNASMVMVGLELVSPISLTGALSLWFSVALSLGGFGLTLRALEARFGRLALTDLHGLYDSSPMLAVCFMVTGLACVGFPGTMGFISAELLVDGAVKANVYLGLIVAVAGMLTGIAVVRAYVVLFLGARHASTVSLQVGMRERIAVLTLTALLLLGGLFPQPGLSSRQHAAEAILADRAMRRVDNEDGLAKVELK
jgi:NADH-quinone oxidoreductase subunit M